MKFNFEIPAPLQLGTPISYYKGLLPDYRYLDISYLKMSFTGEIVGHCAVGDNDYTIRANVEGESVSSVEILDVLETDSFLDIPLSLPNRKLPTRQDRQNLMDETTNEKEDTENED
ncbi:hypothetical protein ACQZET_02185 [Corynebacterium diphtheriae]